MKNKILKFMDNHKIITVIIVAILFLFAIPHLLIGLLKHQHLLVLFLKANKKHG